MNHQTNLFVEAALSREHNQYTHLHDRRQEKHRRVERVGSERPVRHHRGVLRVNVPLAEPRYRQEGQEVDRELAQHRQAGLRAENARGGALGRQAAERGRPARAVEESRHD